MSTIAAPVELLGPPDVWARRAPWTGIGFVVFFVAGILASSPPDDTAPDARWVANYATSGKQASHLASGVFIILAALCLLSFLTHLWTRVSKARPPHAVSPLPLVAAAVSAACIAAGGTLAGLVGGDLLMSSARVPDADLLRFTNDLGFVMVGVPGMLAAALSIAALSIQAHAAGIFGRRLRLFSLVVAVVLLASVAFIPIAALLIWSVVVAVALLRDRDRPAMG